jgi:hypothetical protein
MTQQLFLLLGTVVVAAAVSLPADLVRRRRAGRASAAQVVTGAVLVLLVALAGSAGLIVGAAGVAVLVAGLLLGSVAADQLAGRLTGPLRSVGDPTGPAGMP